MDEGVPDGAPKWICSEKALSSEGCSTNRLSAGVLRTQKTITKLDAKKRGHGAYQPGIHAEPRELVIKDPLGG